MHYPRAFDRSRAIQIAGLILPVYEQLEAFQRNTEWVRDFNICVGYCKEQLPAAFTGEGMQTARLSVEYGTKKELNEQKQAKVEKFAV